VLADQRSGAAARAADSRRSAPLRGDVPPQGARRCATSDRSSTACRVSARAGAALLRAFGSLAGVRRATREELGAIVGAKAAAAVIDYFAKTA
jgi:hypothetical protein